MFVNDNVEKHISAYTSYGLYISIVMPCHRVLTMKNLDHYIIYNFCQRQHSFKVLSLSDYLALS